MRKPLLLFLFSTIPLLIQAADQQSADGQYSRSGIVYIDVNIDQPNVEDCYETSVPDPVEAPGWFKVYPNPNHGTFSVEMDHLNEGEKISIVIHDLAGKKVHRSDVVASGTQLVHELNVSTIPKGIYLIKVQFQHHVSVERLIIF